MQTCLPVTEVAVLPTPHAGTWLALSSQWVGHALAELKLVPRLDGEGIISARKPGTVRPRGRYPGRGEGVMVGLSSPPAQRTEGVTLGWAWGQLGFQKWRPQRGSG